MTIPENSLYIVNINGVFHAQCGLDCELCICKDATFIPVSETPVESSAKDYLLFLNKKT